jgi:methylitaconate Delta-isomerase
MNEMIRCPVVIYRGGTSKGIFIKENDLPDGAALRDRFICALFGSPDKRQIDGLGGADSLTSKLAIIGPPSRLDADVDYTFGQVDILAPKVLYDAVCGNISAAVGPYAIDEGLVRATAPQTEVRIHNKNIGRIIVARVPVENHQVKTSGDFAIDGVPGTGAPIELNWADTVGANTGSLLPTGKPRDTLKLKGRKPIVISIVDVGNPGVFVRAEDLGLKGTESPEEVDSNQDLLALCEAIVGEVGRKIGKAAYLTYVAPAQSYVNHVSGKKIKATEADFLVRMIYMGKMHKAYAASQITCCGTASRVAGTIVHEVASRPKSGGETVRLGHPAGVADLEVVVAKKDDGIYFPRISVYRTARRLMEGYAFIRPELLGGSDRRKRR